MVSESQQICASCSPTWGGHWSEASEKLASQNTLQDCSVDGEQAHPKTSLAEFTAKENESILSASQESATHVSVDYVMSPLVETAVYSSLIPISLSIGFVHRDLRHLTSSSPHTKE